MSLVVQTLVDAVCLPRFAVARLAIFCSFVIEPFAFRGRYRERVVSDAAAFLSEPNLTRRAVDQTSWPESKTFADDEQQLSMSRTGRAARARVRRMREGASRRATPSSPSASTGFAAVGREPRRIALTSHLSPRRRSGLSGVIFATRVCSALAFSTSPA